jgi:ABC-type glycerol-3-phosphate transport system substrate-binding protein
MRPFLNRRFLGVTVVIVLIVVIAVVLNGNISRTPIIPTRITFWDYYTTQSPAIEAGIAAFEAANPDIKVERKQRTLGEQIVMLEHTGYGAVAAPDVFIVPPPANVPFDRMVGNAGLLAWNDFPDFQTFRRTFPYSDTAFAEGYNTFGGKVYSAPLDLPVPSLFLYINADLYRKAGMVNADGSLIIPNTIDALIANSRGIVEAAGKYSLGFGGASGKIEAFWMLCQLTDPYIVDHKLGWNAQKGEYEFSRRVCFSKVIQYLLTMRDAQLIWPDSMTADDAKIRELFAKGEIAHYLGDASAILDWQTTNPNFKNYVVARIPLVNSERPVTYFYTSPGGTWVGIHSFSQQKEASWRFVKFLYSTAFQDIWAKQGNGLGIFTSENALPADSPWRAVQTMRTLVVPGPDSIQRKPELSKVKLQFIGVTPTQLLEYIYTGQITDIEAALIDLDSRSNDTLNNAIINAHADGQTVERADFVFEDWDPRLAYITLTNYDNAKLAKPNSN